MKAAYWALVIGVLVMAKAPVSAGPRWRSPSYHLLSRVTVWP
jgi:hypothetical protein